MVHSFSIPSPGQGVYPSFHFLSILFYGQPGQLSPQFCKFFFFFIIRSGRLGEIKWWVCVTHSPGQILSCAYTICTYVHISCTIPSGSTFPLSRAKSYTLSVLMCCTRLLSFRLYHHITYICCCVLSILALIWLVLIALFCAAIKRDSILLIKFPFLSYVHFFSCEMLLISCLKRS